MCLTAWSALPFPLDQDFDTFLTLFRHFFDWGAEFVGQFEISACELDAGNKITESFVQVCLDKISRLSLRSFAHNRGNTFCCVIQIQNLNLKMWKGIALTTEQKCHSLCSKLILMQQFARAELSKRAFFTLEQTCKKLAC